MRRGSVFGLRGFMVVLVATIGLIGMTASPTAAQDGVICYVDNRLSLVDGDDNGQVSIAELEEFIAEFAPGNTELINLVAEARAEGVTAIQYEGCDPNATATVAPTTAPQTPDATTPAATTTPETPGATTTPDATTPAATTTPETPGATTTPVTPDATTAPDNGDDDDDDNGNGAGDDDGVTDLPETGQGPASDDSSELVLLLGAASAMMLAGGFAWQRRRIA